MPKSAFSNLCRVPAHLPCVAHRWTCSFKNGQAAIGGRSDDDGGTREANSHAHQVPAIKPATLDGPELEHRSRYVNAAISSVGPSGGIAVHQRQQVGEQGQRRHAGNQSQDRLVHASPGPEGEAASDLGKGGSDVGRTVVMTRLWQSKGLFASCGDGRHQGRGSVPPRSPRTARV